MMSPLARATSVATPARGNQNRVLLICYHFPPDASVGAMRPAKFAKYLSRLGWQPYILTVKDHYMPARDDSRLAEVTHLPIVRTRLLPTVLQLTLALIRPFRRVPSGVVMSSVSADDLPAGQRRGRGLAFNLKRYLNSLFELPDKQIGWLIPAVWRAYRLVKTRGIRLVIASSPPRTTALIGLILSYLAPVRLVTDLRDPWFTPYLRDPFWLSLEDIAVSRSFVADAIQRRLEKKVIERSATVITTTKQLALALQRSYPRLSDGRIATIPNGYDTEDFEGLGSFGSPGRFRISYIGTLCLDRTPKPLLAAVSELVREGRLAISDLEINLIGDVRSTKDGSLDYLIRSSGLTDCVKVEDPISHRESLLRMMQADVLVLLQPYQYCSVPAKLFEYLASRRPILCLANDGATANLIKGMGAGLVVRPNDVGAIKAAVLELFHAHRTGQPRMHGSDISIFERAVLAQQLSGLLQRLL